MQRTSHAHAARIHRSMIQVAPGDLVSIAANGRFYYALLIERIRMFGGCWSFVFHRTSSRVLTAPEVLGESQGFNAFVDYIWSKREKRIERIARKVDATAFRGPGFLKATHPFKGKAPFWFIYDMSFKQVARVTELSEEQARYPYHQTIDDVVMVNRVDARWQPDDDPRILGGGPTARRRQG
jgi:hypothetical protein